MSSKTGIKKIFDFKNRKKIDIIQEIDEAIFALFPQKSHKDFESELKNAIRVS